MQSETMNVSVDRPDEAALITDANNALSVVEAIEIDGNDMYEIAASELSTIKGKAKQLEEQRKKITKPLDDAKKAVMDLFRKPIEILGTAENSLKRAMLSYNQEQQRKQLEEQRKASEAAEAERQKQLAEAKKREDEAKAAAEAGDTEKAAALQEEADNVQMEAEMITAPVVIVEKGKASGISTRKTYKAKVVDMKLLLQAVLDGKVPEGVIQVNDSVLNQQARSLKETMKYPGVEVYTEENIAARSA